MTFGKKTISQEIKETWALVLNPIRGEITKSRMIERMVQVFPLAIEEADDLIENTPIVLLEGLDRVTGDQMKNYFCETGADLILTDDKAFQRRCFRAIWPSPPKFDFVRPVSDNAAQPSGFDSGAAHKQNELEEIIRQSDSAVLKNIFDSSTTEVSEMRGKQSIEAKETVFSQDQTVSSENADSPELEEIWRKNKLAEVELATSHALLEEKITCLVHEKNELQSLIANLQKENVELKSTEGRLLELAEELKDAQVTIGKLEAERAHLVEDIKTQRAERKALTEDLKRSETVQESFLEEKQNILGEVEARVQQREVKFREEKAHLEAHTSDLKVIIQNQKLQIEEANTKWQTVLQEIRLKETEFNESTGELSTLRMQVEESKRMLGQAQQELVGQRGEVEKIRARYDEKIREKLNEVELWKHKCEEWSSAHANLTRELEGIRQKHAGDTHHLTTRNQELQNQLESAQRQVREFTNIVEQQDLLNKRNRIISQLAEKESKLKELNFRQETLEKDFHKMQTSLQTITAEREAIEKEIANDRQAQKHLLEQLKLKEKSRATVVSERNHNKPSSIIGAAFPSIPLLISKNPAHESGPAGQVPKDQNAQENSGQESY